MDVSLSVKQSDIARVVQITDPHLFGVDSGCLLSVNTSESFLAVVNSVKSQAFDFDAILATGDISQDHSEASYLRFVEGISLLDRPCFWLPGNHDYQPNMNAVLPNKCVTQASNVLLGEYWQVISLDSQVSSVPYGKLSDEQLLLLDDKLTQYPERHALVLLHHNSLPVGSAWLDMHCLRERERFWEVVGRHSNVRVVACGHVHQDSQNQYQGVEVLTTPSTCIQFKPNHDEFALDSTSPGWREIELYSDGSIATQVKRLDNGLFLPDFTSTGY
ncbi:3',5'-cyclic-AMP phosphodiesterase [Vibrio sp. RC27]